MPHCIYLYSVSYYITTIVSGYDAEELLGFMREFRGNFLQPGIIAPHFTKEDVSCGFFDTSRQIQLLRNSVMPGAKKPFNLFIIT